MAETPRNSDSEDLSAANRAHKAGDLAGAEVYYRRVLKRHPDHLPIAYSLAAVLYEKGAENMPEALSLLDAVATHDPLNPAVEQLCGQIHEFLGHWPEAAASYRRVIECQPDVPDPYLRIKTPLVLLGAIDELVELYDRAIRTYPRMPLERTADFVDQQAAALERNLPGVLFVTMPKSASIYILLRFVGGLRVPPCRVSLDLFPVDHVVPSWAESLALGGAVCQEHIDASAANLRQLSTAGLTRLIIHVRDPRQAALSWAHHLDSLTGERARLGRLVSPLPPDDYAPWPLGDKLDWVIDHHLPLLVAWVEGWVRCADDAASEMEVLFTRYEDFRQDEGAFVRSVLRFHGIDEGAFSDTPVSISKDKLHMRKGEAEEWREVFTADQQHRAGAMLTDELCARFGWKR